jgi:hypothetical protein
MLKNRLLFETFSFLCRKKEKYTRNIVRTNIEI